MMSQTSQYWFRSLQGALSTALPAFGCTATRCAMLWESWMLHQLCPGGNHSCMGNMGWSFGSPSPGGQQRFILHCVSSDALARQVSSDLIPRLPSSLSRHFHITCKLTPACFTPITSSETFLSLWCPVETLLLFLTHE